jgi:hypothetical protein
VTDVSSIWTGIFADISAVDVSYYSIIWMSQIAVAHISAMIRFYTTLCNILMGSLYEQTLLF